MSYLVDTHCLIWSLMDPDRLSSAEHEILLDPAITKFFSKVSCWEIAIKYGLGKLDLTGITPEEILPAALHSGYELYDISAEDLLSSHRLPPGRNHRDPFDRLLVWQCIRNKLVFVSSDRKIRQYTKHGLKLVKDQ